MATVLVDGSGAPVPSPEIQRRLKQIHPGLYLRYVQAIGQHWAICMTWFSDDPRREMIQRGEVDPKKAYDIIGYLPLACSPDEAPAYIEKTFRQYPVREVQQFAEYMHLYHKEPAQKAAEEAIAEVLDSADPALVARNRVMSMPAARPKKSLSRKPRT
jgi:hypothetical protein